MLDYNHLSRVIPGKKKMSPVVRLIVNKLVNSGSVAEVNSSQKARIVYLHFGGAYMLLKYLVNRGKEKTIVVFHGTDLHGYIQDFTIMKKMRYRLNSWSNYLLMFLCDDIYVVSNSLLQFVPMKYVPKTSILFLGVDFDAVRLSVKPEKLDLFAFVDNNNRGIKNYDLARDYAKATGSGLLRLTGLEHGEFLSALSSCNRGLIITSFQEASPNVLKESLALGVKVTCVNVGDCLDIIQRFGGRFIGYDGASLQDYESLPSYSLSYLSLDATIAQLTNG